MTELTSFVDRIQKCNYYEIFEVPEYVPSSTVRRRYQEIVEKYALTEFDRDPDITPSESELYERIVRKVQEAYRTLMDETQREYYDRLLKKERSEAATRKLERLAPQRPTPRKETSAERPQPEANSSRVDSVRMTEKPQASANANRVDSIRTSRPMGPPQSEQVPPSQEAVDSAPHFSPVSQAPRSDKDQQRPTGNPRMLHHQGNEKLAEGNFKEAADYLLQALELDPNNSAILADLGSALFHIPGRLNESERYTRRSMNLDAHNTTSMYTLARIQEQEGQVGLAMLTYEQLLLHDSKHTEAKKALNRLRKVL